MLPAPVPKPAVGQVFGISLALPPWLGERTAETDGAFNAKPTLINAMEPKMSLQNAPTLTIRYEDQGNKGRYAATVDGIAGEGELTISKVSDALIIADHAAVPDSMRGLGVAKALAERLITEARDNGQRIVPLCPFVRSFAMKNKEATADVIQW